MSLTRGGRAGLIAGGTALVILLVFIVVVAYSFGAFRVNEAERGFQPIDAGLREHGARQLCASGDPGYGPDNIEPWFSASYEVSKTSGIRETVDAVTSSAGFPLSEIGTPQSDPDAQFPGYEYQGQRGGEVLSVTVTTGVGQDPGCGSKPHHNASTSIVGVGLSYPDHQGQPARVEPTRTPVPTSAAAWADSTFGQFDPVTVSGTGSQVVPLPLGAHAGIATMHSSSPGAFVVASGTTDGQPGPDLLVSTEGAYDGVAPFGLETAGVAAPGSLVVTTDGSWTLTIASLSSAPVASFPVVGDGDAVLLGDGTAREQRAFHDGGGLFEIRVLTGDGPTATPVFEPGGAFDGPVPLYSRYWAVVVTAQGDWRLGP